MADDLNLPRNYDLCVSVFSSNLPLRHFIPELDGVMEEKHPEIYDLDGHPRPPFSTLKGIPFSQDDNHDPQRFDSLADCGRLHLLSDKHNQPIPAMTRELLCKSIRSTTLVHANWSKQVADRIHNGPQQGPNHQSL